MIKYLMLFAVLLAPSCAKIPEKIQEYESLEEINKFTGTKAIEVPAYFQSDEIIGIYLSDVPNISVYSVYPKEFIVPIIAIPNGETESKITDCRTSHFLLRGRFEYLDDMLVLDSFQDLQCLESNTQ